MRMLDLTRTCHMLVLSFCLEICFANTRWEMTNSGADMEKCAHPQPSGMVVKGTVLLSQNVATEYQCFALCVYTSSCDSFFWRETTGSCQLRSSVVKTTDPLLFVPEDYKGIAERLCMYAKGPCAHRPCRSYEVCVPIQAAVHHICLPTADLPGTQDITPATQSAVDGVTAVMTPSSSTLTSVNQMTSTDIATSPAEKSSPLASETIESSALTVTSSSTVTSAITDTSSALTSESPQPPNTTTSQQFYAPDLPGTQDITPATHPAVDGVTAVMTPSSSTLTSVNQMTSTDIATSTVETSSPLASETAESSALTVTTSSTVTSAITDTSSALTSESPQPPNTTNSQQLFPPDLPGTQDITPATQSAVDGVTAVMTPSSSTLTSVNQMTSTDIATSPAEKSSPLASETIESSALTVTSSSTVTSAITDTSSALTSESPQPPNTTNSQQLFPHTYVGCYDDNRWARVLNGPFEVSTTMTRNLCFQFCTSYKYAGLEYSEECFCDDVLAPNRTLLNDSECWRPCHGNRDETCGGYYAIEIYELVQT